ncbi:hypothetical protein [Prevotella sp. MA2016]|nr:hypothetical protein [Prevotella sp. MA2016]
MKKKVYIKPSMHVVELRHQACLLQASSIPPDGDEFDDWFG